MKRYNVLELNSLFLLYSFSDGRKEEVHFDKITSRIVKLCYGLDMDYLDPVSRNTCT